MAPHKKRPYECICCGYATTRKSCMVDHFYKVKKPCPKCINNIELTDEIKEYILANRIFTISPKDKVNQTTLFTAFADLKIENSMLKNKKDEKFYQLIVEKYLVSTHKKIKSGITDVTNDKIHAEIKRWPKYKDALGQLIAYNHDLPREELHAYMFDKYKQTSIDNAVATLKASNIKVFTFITTKTQVDIIEYETNTIVYTHVIDL